MIKRALLPMILLAAFVGSPSGAASTTIVAGPGSFLTTYTTPVAIVGSERDTSLVNQDAAFHGLESVNIGSDDPIWCVRYSPGACPLFWADLTVPFGGSNQIFGLENLQPGTTYAFRCSIESFKQNMRGLILTLE